MFTSFSDFSNYCEALGKRLHTIVETKLYEDYNYGNVAFMTDKFGGTYCNFHYDLKTNEIIDWYGHKDAYKVENLESLESYITEKMNHEISVRNLDNIYEMINAEY